MKSKDLVLFALGALYAIALTAIVLWLWAWWEAFPNWTVTIHFNKFREAWVEGVALHLALLFLMLPPALFIFGRERKKDGQG